MAMYEVQFSNLHSEGRRASIMTALKLLEPEGDFHRDMHGVTTAGGVIVCWITGLSSFSSEEQQLEHMCRILQCLVKEGAPEAGRVVVRDREDSEVVLTFSF